MRYTLPWLCQLAAAGTQQHGLETEIKNWPADTVGIE
eukprot:COSAG01_NODE_616_length_14815_cov_8.518076_4_plen_37_part_00